MQKDKKTPRSANKKIIADFHLHTIASGHAYSTIQEYALEAKKMGLKYIAMADHGPNMPGGPHIYHFENIKMVPKELYGVRILRGSEVNIIDDAGSLDLPDRILRDLEFVLFTFHPKCGYEDGGTKKNTEVMLKAMKNPNLYAIAHLENPKFLVDYEAVVSEAAKRDILIEINNSSNISRAGSYGYSMEVLTAVKKTGAYVCLGTDSHFSGMVGKFDYAFKLIKDSGIRTDRIINYSQKLIDKYVLSKDKHGY